MTDQPHQMKYYNRFIDDDDDDDDEYPNYCCICHDKRNQLNNTLLHQRRPQTAINQSRCCVNFEQDSKLETTTLCTGRSQQSRI